MDVVLCCAGVMPFDDDALIHLFAATLGILFSLSLSLFLSFSLPED